MAEEYPPLLLTYAGAPGGVGSYWWETPEDIVEVDGKTALELLRAQHAGFREPTVTAATFMAQEPATHDHSQGYIPSAVHQVDITGTQELDRSGVLPNAEGPKLQEAIEVAAPPIAKRKPGRPKGSTTKKG